jgi:septal ring factor EnvC (AmiA/AmiB activator)
VRHLPLGFIPALILALGLASSAPAQGPQDLLPALENRPADEAGRFSLRLSLAERLERPDLARLEDAAQSLSARVKAQDERLSLAKADSERLLIERAALENEIKAKSARLQNLLPELWTTSIAVKAGMDSAVSPWDEADRRLAWLGAAYAAANQELARQKEKSAELTRNLAQQEELRAQTTQLYEQLEGTKDSLLEAKLRLLKEVMAVRRDQAGEREMLRRVLGLLVEMNFQPQPFSNQSLDKNQETLIWPVEGPLLAPFAPQDTPPRTGVWLAAGPGGKVVASAGGKVAYNDNIRGLGRVTILSHGQDTFTIYGNLAKSPLKLGQRLAAGEALGQADQYPAGGGPALYFELRFREKPINPTGWFALSP